MEITMLRSRSAIIKANRRKDLYDGETLRLYAGSEGYFPYKSGFKAKVKDQEIEFIVSSVAYNEHGYFNYELLYNGENYSPPWEKEDFELKDYVQLELEFTGPSEQGCGETF